MLTGFGILSCQTKPKDNTSTESAQHEFTNPILSSGPDPWAEYYNGFYYVTHSTGNSLKLYRTRAMSRLRHGESKIVWTPPTSGMNSKEIG
jgi:GH43 family beta-xylosidase